MPTFDFNNIVKKLIATAVAVSCSPVFIVLTVATIVHTIFDGFTNFYDQIINFSVFQISDFGNDINGGFLGILLYAVHFDLFVELFNKVIYVASSVINYMITLSASLFTYFVVKGVYSVIRRTVNQWK